MEKEKFDKIQAITNAAMMCDIALEAMHTIAKQVQKGYAEYGKTLTEAVDDNTFTEDDCLEAIAEEQADQLMYQKGYERHIRNKNIPKYDPKTTTFSD